MSLMTLIDAYLKVDKIDDALKILNKMVDRCFKVVATLANRVFNELIKNGKAMNCAHILSKMGEQLPVPDPTCYEVVIKGLCGEGLLDESRELPNLAMIRDIFAEVFKSVWKVFPKIIFICKVLEIRGFFLKFQG